MKCYGYDFLLFFSDKIEMEGKTQHPLCSPGLIYFHRGIIFRTNGSSPSLILPHSNRILPGMKAPAMLQVSTIPTASVKSNTGPGAAFLQRTEFHTGWDGTELAMAVMHLSIQLQQFCWRMKTRIQIYQNTIAIAATKMHSLQETILSFCAQKERNGLF